MEPVNQTQEENAQENQIEIKPEEYEEMKKNPRNTK